MLKQSRKDKITTRWYGAIPKDAPVFYRAKMIHVYNDDPKLEIEEWRGVKETPFGWWIVQTSPWHNSKARWMSKHATKRFAWHTKEEAVESLIRRRINAHQFAINRLGEIKEELMALYDLRPDHDELNYMVRNGIVYQYTAEDPAA